MRAFLPRNIPACHLHQSTCHLRRSHLGSRRNPRLTLPHSSKPMNTSPKMPFSLAIGKHQVINRALCAVWESAGVGISHVEMPMYSMSRTHASLISLEGKNSRSKSTMIHFYRRLVFGILLRPIRRCYRRVPVRFESN